jgi:diacylglycerol kinase family enzyme
MAASMAVETIEPETDASSPPALGPWAKGKADVIAIAVVNEAAHGTGPGAKAKLLEILAAQNVQVRETYLAVDDLSHAAAHGADVIVVLGGDGTARAAAAAFADGPPLILLPGGTLNVLPHALYGDRPWPDALRAALAHGRVTRLVGGEANGKLFFVAALFGAPTLLARVREAMRAGDLRAAWRRLAHVSRRFLSRRIAARPALGFAARAEAIGVLCPAYSGEVDGRSLEWVRLDTARVTDMLRLGLRAVIGGWRDDPTIDLSHTREGEIRSLGVIPATLDGEPTTFVSRVRVRMLGHGPKVVVLD